MKTRLAYTLCLLLLISLAGVLVFRYIQHSDQGLGNTVTHATGGIATKINNTHIELPSKIPANSTVFVEVTVSAMGHIFMPYLVLRSAEIEQKQYFTLGASGKKIIDLSAFFSEQELAPEQLSYSVSNVTIDDIAKIYIYEPVNLYDNKVLILAPISNHLLKCFVYGLLFSTFCYALIRSNPFFTPNHFHQKVSAKLASFSFTLYVVNTPLLNIGRASIIDGQGFLACTPINVSLMILLCLAITFIAYVIARLTEFHTNRVYKFFNI